MWRTDCSRTRSSLVAAVPSTFFSGPWKVKQKTHLATEFRQRWWKLGLEVELTTDTRKDRVPPRIWRVFVGWNVCVFHHGWSSTRRDWRYTSMDSYLLQKSIKGWDDEMALTHIATLSYDIHTYICGFSKICCIFTTISGDLMWQAHVWNHQVDKADRMFIVQPIPAGPRHRVACKCSFGSWCLYTYHWLLHCVLMLSTMHLSTAQHINGHIYIYIQMWQTHTGMVI